MSALDKQVGGEHYKQFPIQPVEFCYKNKIPYLEATAIKYLCRWRDKGGIADLDKAIHFIELLKEFEIDAQTQYVPVKAAEKRDLTDRMIDIKMPGYYYNPTDDTICRKLKDEKNVTSTL